MLLGTTAELAQGERSGRDIVLSRLAKGLLIEGLLRDNVRRIAEIAERFSRVRRSKALRHRFRSRRC